MGHYHITNGTIAYISVSQMNVEPVFMVSHKTGEIIFPDLGES